MQTIRYSNKLGVFSRREAASSVVDESLVEAVASGGVAHDRLVTDAKMLHPWDKGLQFMKEKGWKKVEVGAGAYQYQLSGDKGAQCATFIRRDGYVIVDTRTKQFAQTIVMGPQGQVLRNSGKHPTK